jgi:hypothetical protein
MNAHATFPATPEEYEEYVATMQAIACEIEATTPDPEPSDFYDKDDEDDAWSGGEDRYLDASWEDRHDDGGFDW